MSDILRVAVGRAPLPFEVENVTTGDIEKFEIRELSGADHERYLNFMNGAMEIVPSTGEVTKIRSYKGLQTHLLAMCVFGEDNKLVKEAKIASWPPSAIAQIYEAADDYNQLSKQAKAAAKGDGGDEEGND